MKFTDKPSLSQNLGTHGHQEVLIEKVVKEVALGQVYR